MANYKEFKKELKQVHITNDYGFTKELEKFLEKNQNIKIIQTIVHKPYHVTIIYEVAVPI
jgi:hypothetical protein